MFRAAAKTAVTRRVSRLAWRLFPSVGYCAAKTAGANTVAPARLRGISLRFRLRRQGTGGRTHRSAPTGNPITRRCRGGYHPPALFLVQIRRLAGDHRSPLRRTPNPDAQPFPTPPTQYFFISEAASFLHSFPEVSSCFPSSIFCFFLQAA